MTIVRKAAPWACTGLDKHLGGFKEGEETPTVLLGRGRRRSITGIVDNHLLVHALYGGNPLS